MEGLGKLKQVNQDSGTTQRKRGKEGVRKYEFGPEEDTRSSEGESDYDQKCIV